MSALYRGPNDDRLDDRLPWANRVLFPQAFVKNTFVNFIDEPVEMLKRSASAGDLSQSSGELSQNEQIRFWLPSLSSSSSTTEHRIREGEVNFVSAPLQRPLREGQTAPTNTSSRPGGDSTTSESANRAASAAGTSEAEMLAARVHQELRGSVPLEKLEEFAAAGYLAHIPRDASGNLTSVGSIGHATGQCSPCAYWFKNICKYKVDCHYCHFIHPGQKSKRLRPSKQTRMRLRKLEAQKAVASNGDVSVQSGEENCMGDDDEEDMEGVIEHL